MLLDLSLPDMDGLSALPLILAASPDTRVVVYSGYAAHEFARPGTQMLRRGRACLEEEPRDATVRATPGRRAGNGARNPGTAQLTPTAMDSLASGTVGQAEVVAILNAAADAMFRLDAAGRVTRCNRSARRILGHGAEELLGRPFQALLRYPPCAPRSTTP